MNDIEKYYEKPIEKDIRELIESKKKSCPFLVDRNGLSLFENF